MVLAPSRALLCIFGTVCQTISNRLKLLNNLKSGLKQICSINVITFFSAFFNIISLPILSAEGSYGWCATDPMHNVQRHFGCQNRAQKNDTCVYTSTTIFCLFGESLFLLVLHPKWRTWDACVCALHDCAKGLYEKLSIIIIIINCLQHCLKLIKGLQWWRLFHQGRWRETSSACQRSLRGLRLLLSIQDSTRPRWWRRRRKCWWK